MFSSKWHENKHIQLVQQRKHITTSHHAREVPRKQLFWCFLKTIYPRHDHGRTKHFQVCKHDAENGASRQPPEWAPIHPPTLCKRRSNISSLSSISLTSPTMTAARAASPSPAKSVISSPSRTSSHGGGGGGGGGEEEEGVLTPLTVTAPSALLPLSCCCCCRFVDLRSDLLVDVADVSVDDTAARCAPLAAPPAFAAAAVSSCCSCSRRCCCCC